MNCFCHCYINVLKQFQNKSPALPDLTAQQCSSWWGILLSSSDFLPWVLTLVAAGDIQFLLLLRFVFFCFILWLWVIFPCLVFFCFVWLCLSLIWDLFSVCMSRFLWLFVSSLSLMVCLCCCSCLYLSDVVLVLSYLRSLLVFIFLSWPRFSFQLFSPSWF